MTPLHTRADVLILGQGLAGTLLAWELERAGISFAITDPKTDAPATLAAAGIINPITGRRLVKSWRIDTLLPLARATYREMEAELDVPLWREMRVRRLFADDSERGIFAEKQRSGELAPFVESTNGIGFWIRDAGRVNLQALLAAARQRWERQGRFITLATSPRDPRPLNGSRGYDLLIDCTGKAAAVGCEFGFVPFQFSKGEVLEIAIDGLATDVVLNRRQWVLPVDQGTAWVGATHEPGVTTAQTTHPARATLASAARGILGRDFEVVGQRAGVRVNVPDKLPVAGHHPELPRLGLINALGAKGALFAPMLAKQWVNHLSRKAPFDPAIDVARFVK